MVIGANGIGCNIKADVLQLQHKKSSHSISSNIKWLLDMTGSAAILGTKVQQLGPMFTLATIQYELWVIGSNSVGPNK